MRKSKVSMQDIADRLGISRNAVSLALARKPGVSEETQEMVFYMAKKLGYAKIPGTQSTENKILILIPEYIRDDSYFYNQIYWAVDERAKQKGYIAIMASLSPQMEQDRSLPELYNDFDFSGIIVIGVVQVEYIQFLTTVTENLVVVDNTYWDVPLDSIVTANTDAGYKMTRYLLDNGHRKIGFIGSIQTTTSIFERWCGYQCAMQNAGLRPYRELSILASSPLSSLLSNSDELCEKMQQLPEIPDAFVCGGDRIAIAAIQSLKKLGYRIPEDVSIVGIDDIDMSQVITPRLTTARIDRARMGREAIDLLIRHLNRSSHRTKIELYTQLVVRDSVCKRNNENSSDKEANTP